MESKKLIIANKTEQLEQVQLFIDQLSAAWSLKPDLVFELNLVIEEYITNLVNYGYRDTEIHKIMIEITRQKSQLKIIITDDTGPFNILETPENREIDKPVEERRVGGLGIHFIKMLTDEIEYRSDKGKNKLVLIKRLK